LLTEARQAGNEWKVLLAVLGGCASAAPKYSLGMTQKNTFRFVKGFTMEINVSTKDLAQILKITPRRIQQLAQKEVLRREADGTFKAHESIEDYYRWKATETNWHTGRGKAREEYAHEHALLEKAKKEMAELTLGVMTGTLVYADDVEAQTFSRILTCRTRLLGMPAKLAHRIAASKTVGKIESLLREEILQAMDALKPEKRDGKGA
jgi:phage terminase Nu1 subunit (DNA packaging protein)